MTILQLENQVCVNMILHTFHTVLMGSCSIWNGSEMIGFPAAEMRSRKIKLCSFLCSMFVNVKFALKFSRLLFPYKMPKRQA